MVAVGGTSLYLNADNSYNHETAWGQATGTRFTPDVSAVADPATGVWVADTYNLPSSNPWVSVGGTSLSAPTWAGLLVLANQGRAAAGKATFDSASLDETQQALYSVPVNDFHQITSGSNGIFTASAGYNLATGLGSPVANLLIPDLINATPNGGVNAQRSVTVTAAREANAITTYGPNNTIAAGIVNAFDAEFVAAPRPGSGTNLSRTVQVSGAAALSANAQLPDASKPQAQPGPKSSLSLQGSFTVNGFLPTTDTTISGRVIDLGGFEYNPLKATDNTTTQPLMFSNGGLRAAEDSNSANNVTKLRDFFQDMAYSNFNKLANEQNLAALDAIFADLGRSE